MDLITGTPEQLQKEFHLVRLSNVTFARQNFVYKRFSKKTLSYYDDYDIVGYTLNEKKTMIIRIFYNKRNDNHHVVESVYFQNVILQQPGPFVH